ncbi:hypothetical protein XAP7430_1060004 [Xanthomonas phaseoli pv. phaseoli]|uniref:Transposase n=1 Tax=Xanthomonas campestris pv. phaseoli TaxID=317013 RepID=A0AB38DVB5_XANCH|nr:hypothetical protein XAP7430_1060004 [Xanthomonas phaseoli pv. phaseoli]
MMRRRYYSDVLARDLVDRYASLRAIARLSGSSNSSTTSGKCQCQPGRRNALHCSQMQRTRHSLHAVVSTKHARNAHTLSMAHKFQSIRMPAINAFFRSLVRVGSLNWSGLMT